MTTFTHRNEAQKASILDAFADADADFDADIEESSPLVSAAIKIPNFELKDTSDCLGNKGNMKGDDKAKFMQLILSSPQHKNKDRKTSMATSIAMNERTETKSNMEWISSK